MENFMMTPDLEHVLTLTIEVAGDPIHISDLPQGYSRRIVFVSGGEFSGPKLRGKLLPGGGDFLIMRPDGGMELDVRLVLMTDDGYPIYMTYTGRRNGPPDVMKKYFLSAPVGEGEDYFRTLVRLETAAPELLWLNDCVCIGSGTRAAAGPIYHVFSVA